MEKFIIRAGMFIDGTGKEALPDVDILIEGGKISAVGKKGTLGDFPTHNYEDKVIMPGMINCHVHVEMEPVGDPAKWFDEHSDAEIILSCNNNLAAYLKSGVTYVRNVGSGDSLDIKMKKAIEKGITKGPGIVPSSQCLCMTGGHGWAMGALECDGVDECRKAARKVLRDGAEVVKFMSSGGVMTPGMSVESIQLNLDEIEAIVEEAHKAGKRTATHAHGAKAIYNAVLAGVDSIEHGTFLTDETVQLMIEKGTYLVPTFLAPHHIVENSDNGKMPAYIVEKGKKIQHIHIESFQKAHKAGVKIAMGTDAGTCFNHHGGSAQELELLVKYGMTNEEAILASTKVAAELLQIDSFTGTLEVGKNADLIVLAKNPLKDITAVKEVIYTYKNGERHIGNVIE